MVCGDDGNDGAGFDFFYRFLLRSALKSTF